jgi:hypothetical protein
MAVCLWVRPTPVAPSPSCCLPSKGLPLCCRPAKVHTSPATPWWGLSPTPTPRAWTHSISPLRLEGLPRAFGFSLLAWASPGELLQSQAGTLPEEGEELSGKVAKRTLAGGGELGHYPRASVETRS